jgi:flagellar hook protein FlgE
MLDPATGNVVGAANSIVQVSSAPIPANRTREIAYRANLPTTPATPNSASGAPNSELFATLAPLPAGYPAGYEPRVTTATSPPPAVIGADEPRFMSQSVSGGSITAYNSVGAPADLQLRWAKTSNASPETWNLFYRTNSTATGNTPAWRNAGTPVTFNASGQMTSPVSINLENVVVDAVSIGPVDLNFGAGGLTQFASSNGLVQASTIEQDGYATGTLDTVAVTSDGRITGSYSNGRVVTIAEVSVAQFNADTALKRRDGGAYEQTLESGLPIIGLNGATVIGGNVEGSNTDIAEEFSKMIVTQQAYSANTRVVSTSQQMLSDVINMIR